MNPFLAQRFVVSHLLISGCAILHVAPRIATEGPMVGVFESLAMPRKRSTQARRTTSQEHLPIPATMKKLFKEKK